MQLGSWPDSISEHAHGSAVQALAALLQQQQSLGKARAALALRALQAAVRAADPLASLPMLLKELSLSRRQHVFAIGKAGARMARAVEASLPAHLLAGGLALVPDGHGETLACIDVLEASHPVPDQRGVHGSRLLAQRLSQVPETEEVLLLVSGGGSALLAEPADGLALQDLTQIYELLLRSGWPIDRLNRIRSQLLEHAGGRLAARSRAKLRCLVLSDVPGDNLAWVASGPACAWREDPAEALDWLAQLGAPVPAAAVALLKQRLHRPRASPKLAHVEVHCAGSADRSLEAAAAVLAAAGFEVINLGSALSETTGAFAQHSAALLRGWSAQPVRRPCAWLSGGELGHGLHPGPRGRGGRNTAFLAALMHELAGELDYSLLALAADSDGIDGVGGHAGAWFETADMHAAALAHVDPLQALAQNDSAGLFARLDRLIVCGPTHTNVNDIRILLVQPTTPLAGAELTLSTPHD